MKSQKVPTVALVAEMISLSDRHCDALLHNTLKAASENRLTWEETILLIEEIERRTGIWLRLDGRTANRQGDPDCTPFA